MRTRVLQLSRLDWSILMSCILEMSLMAGREHRLNCSRVYKQLIKLVDRHTRQCDSDWLERKQPTDNPSREQQQQQQQQPIIHSLCLGDQNCIYKSHTLWSELECVGGGGGGGQSFSEDNFKPLL